MTLADSATWIDHIARPVPALTRLLADERILGHPLVTAEVSLGSLADRRRIIGNLERLEQVRPATMAQTRWLIDTHQLWGVGIGYVDANLLASVLLVPGASLMTRDKRLRTQAERLGVAYQP